MEREFVSYEQAVALKKLGFDEHVFCTYNHSKDLIFEDDGPNRNSDIDYYNDEWTICSAPLKQQVFKWFREKYGCYCDIWQYEDDLSFAFAVKIKFQRYDAEIGFKTYEEAENACIDKLIKLAKQQDK